MNFKWKGRLFEIACTLIKEIIQAIEDCQGGPPGQMRGRKKTVDTWPAVPEPALPARADRRIRGRQV
jgi:hypothetical protein